MLLKYLELFTFSFRNTTTCFKWNVISVVVFFSTFNNDNFKKLDARHEIRMPEIEIALNARNIKNTTLMNYMRNK